MPCCQVEHHLFLFVHVRLKILSVYMQKQFHCRVSDTLVSIGKRMIFDKKIAESCSFFFQVRVEIVTFGGLPDLVYGCFSSISVK